MVMSFYKVRSLTHPPPPIPEESEIVSTLSFLKHHLIDAILFSLDDKPNPHNTYKNVLYSIAVWATIMIAMFYLIAIIYKANYPHQPGGVDCLATSLYSFFSCIAYFYRFAFAYLMYAYFKYDGESLFDEEEQIRWLALHFVQYLAVMTPFIMLTYEASTGVFLRIIYQMLVFFLISIPAAIYFFFYTAFTFFGSKTLVTIISLGLYLCFLNFYRNLFYIKRRANNEF